MKKIIIIFIFSICISQQYNHQNHNIREEVLSRYDNGNKKMVIKYSGTGTNEKIVERITYSENDNVILIEKPLENIKIEKTYYENGNLKYEKKYKNNQLDGLVKKYYENGKLKSEVMYIDGNGEGSWTDYYENGSKKVVDVIKGNQISSKIF